MKFFVRLGAVAALVIAGATGAVAAESMRAISFIPKNHPVLEMANEWVNQVNDKLGDQIEINYVGGPEVIGRFQQLEALSQGVVDIVFAPSGDYQDRVPTAQTFVLSRLSPSEERESGFYDYMVEAHAKGLNARYLGRVQVSPFYLWTNKEPESLEDLKGLKMRTGVLYDRFMRELGMVPVTINSPEVYTALKSGVVEGFGWPVTGPRTQGWLEVVTNVIDIPFFGASNVVALMNLDRFNALPEATQQALIDITAEFEPQMVDHFATVNQNEWEAIGDSVNKVTFSEEENETYLDTAYQVEWDALVDKVKEDEIEHLREITGN